MLFLNRIVCRFNALSITFLIYIIPKMYALFYTYAIFFWVKFSIKINLEPESFSHIHIAKLFVYIIN